MITQKEREILRELANKQLELANHPSMKEKKRLWYKHNAVGGERPMIIMEDITFWKEICPPLQCLTPLAIEVEEQLLKNIVIVDLLDDDKVVPDYYKMEYEIEYQRYGIERKKVYASDGLGFHIEPQIECIEEDYGKLSATQYQFPKSVILDKMQEISDIIGDILPVVPVNITNQWSNSLSQQAVELMGTENMFCAMLDEPDEFKMLMKFLADDTIRMLRFQEECGALQLNNENHYMGSGSYCFSQELPQEDYVGNVRSIDTWGHLNSQESVGISIDMYREFILPETKRVASEFGLLYYGCCEPVSDFWEHGVEEIENLRKVSISPWCDELYMAPRLAERNIIYSRKPSPNFLGVQAEFDEQEFRKYIKKSVDAIKTGGCKAEFIFRDIYKLHGNIGKVKRAVQITREETQDLY